MEESPDVVRRLFLLTDHWEHLGILKHDMLVFDTEAEAEPGNLVKTDISDESPLRQLVARDGKYALIFPGDEKDEPIEAESINDLPILCVLKHVLRHMTDESKIAEAVRNSSHDGTGFQN